MFRMPALLATLVALLQIISPATQQKDECFYQTVIPGFYYSNVKYFESENCQDQTSVAQIRITVTGIEQIVLLQKKERPII